MQYRSVDISRESIIGVPTIVSSRHRNRQNPLEVTTTNIAFAKIPDVDQELSGKLNHHKWAICGYRVNDLRQNPLFPRFPDDKDFATNFAIEGGEGQTGGRLFGYIHGSVRGKYKFTIDSSGGATSELWLSTDEDPRKARLIASVNKDVTMARTSEDILLETGQKYFIEALIKYGADSESVYVLWQPPGIGKFEHIARQFLSAFYADKVSKNPAVGYLNRKDFESPSNYKRTAPEPVQEHSIQYYYNTPVVEQETLAGVLPSVSYSPSYKVKDGRLSEWQGIYLVLKHHSAMYPEDTVRITREGNFTHSSREFRANELLPKSEAERVVNEFMSALEIQHKK